MIVFVFDISLSVLTERHENNVRLIKEFVLFVLTSAVLFYTKSTVKDKSQAILMSLEYIASIGIDEYKMKSIGLHPATQLNEMGVKRKRD